VLSLFIADQSSSQRLQATFPLGPDDSLMNHLSSMVQLRGALTLNCWNDVLSDLPKSRIKHHQEPLNGLVIVPVSIKGSNFTIR
jgi:hypothetical protein